MTTPVRHPVRSRQAPERRTDRRPGSRRRARDAERRRLHRRRPREADRRRRHDVDRDDAVQPQPARPRGARQARRPRRGRDTDGVQHDRGLGRRLDGHVGHARVADLARGDRRLDRARRARAPLRRARHARRLRQDEPGRGDGGRPPRHPGGRLLHRLDRPGSLPRARRLDRRRLRGDRRARGREDQRRRPARARVGRLPGRGRLRRPVHRQHDVDDPRLPRALALRHERDPRDAPDEGGGGLRDRPARRAARPRQRDAALVRHEGVLRERRRLRCRDGRLDERRPPPRRDRA